MRKIIEYKVIQYTKDGQTPLDVNVNNHIKDGWEPIGGVSMVSIDHAFRAEIRYTQAMVKYKAGNTSCEELK